MARAGRVGLWCGLLLVVPLAAQRLPAGASAGPLPPARPVQDSATKTPAQTSSAAVLPTPATAAAAPDALLAAHDLEVGTFYFHRGDYVGALARYQDAIQNQPRSA